MNTAKLRYLHGLVESALRVSGNIDTFERNLESGYYNDEGKAAVAYQLDMFKPELLRRLRDIVSHAGELVESHHLGTEVVLASFSAFRSDGQ